MRKVISILFLILLSINIFSAEKYTGSLIWKISGNGLEKPSFIFATHHLLTPDFLDSIPSYSNVWNAVENVVGEVDFTNKQEIANIMQSYLLANDLSLYQHHVLSEYEEREIEKMGSSILGVNDLHILLRFKPSALYIFYCQYLQTTIDPTYSPLHSISMDQGLQDKALRDKKSIEGLESVEEQAQLLFDYATPQIQAEQLSCLIKNTSLVLDELKTLTEYYRQAKLWELYLKYTDKSDGECKYPEDYYKALNEDRNAKWLQTIPSIMSKKPSLFVVGALHLPGEVGLLYKLNEMGYTVEAVK